MAEWIHKKSVQLTCPFCKKEFPFDNGKIDKEIAELSQKVSEIQKWLSEYKLISAKKKKERKRERDVKGAELLAIQERLKELKSLRKSTDQQLSHYEYQIFKNIVKERLGNIEYRKLMMQAEEELLAYKTSGLMLHEYSRSESKSNVTSINKL